MKIRSGLRPILIAAIAFNTPSFAQHRTKVLIISGNASYARAYEVQVSQSGENWEMVAAVNDGDGQMDALAFPPVQARFVKVRARKRAANKWGYSLYEVEVYRK